MQTRLRQAEANSVSISFPARFAAIYLLSQVFPFPFTSIHYFSFFTSTNSHLFNKLVVWAGRNILRIPHFVASSYHGSGDRLFNYVWSFVVLVISFLLALCWQLTIKNRRKNRTIFYWLTAYIQFSFALIMMKYGLEKVIQMQFPFPYTSLTQTYGQSSPMQLMWTFVGYSKTYNLILGLTEMVSGFLVFFRKTILAGALLGIGIMSNVTVLNFCYDVPVKLFALNFLFMAVFLAAPHSKRLIRFFLLNQTVFPKTVFQPALTQKTWQWLIALKYFLAVIVFCFSLQKVRLLYSTWGNGAFAQTPLFGIYEVTTFIRNGDTLPPLQTDTTRWKEISVIYRKTAAIKLMNDSLRNYRFLIDTIHQNIEVGGKDDSTGKFMFTYQKPDSVHLLLHGRRQRDSLTIVLQKKDMNQYLLINRGFHWINEYPYRTPEREKK